MGNFIKKTNQVILFFAFFLFIISAVVLSHEKKKDNSDKKESQQTQQNYQNQKEEDIQPPEGEQWVAPGDEELYKFDINPINPKEGITGGVLVYYGHYIRPPYKVETKPIYENGYEVGVQVIINGLLVNPDPDFIKDRFYKKEKKETIVLTEYERKCYEEYDKASDRVIKDLENIVNEVGLKPENIKIIENKFIDYLSNSKLVSYFKLKSIFSADITLNICNEDPRFNKPETIFFSWGYTKPEKSRAQIEKERWEKDLSIKSSVTHINIGVVQGYNISELDRVSMVLLKKMSNVESIKAIYVITMDFKATKTFYYNLEYKEYLQDRRMGLIK